MAKAYVICDIEVTDPDTYARYRELSGPSLERHGGRFVVRGGDPEALEGSWRPERVVVMEFDDREAARRWYASPDYATAREIREPAASASFILVDGC
jgi:uncharacterized protein (DUF1330 family)